MLGCIILPIFDRLHANGNEIPVGRKSTIDRSPYSGHVALHVAF